jgi:hypothetical protein
MFDKALYFATSFQLEPELWEQQLFGKDCGGGAAPVPGLGCPVQVATIPIDYVRRISVAVLADKLLLPGVQVLIETRCKI